MRGKRGPYKLYLTNSSKEVPRQTLSNWKRIGVRACIDAEHTQSPAAEPMDDDLEPVPSSDSDSDCDICPDSENETDVELSDDSRSPSPAPSTEDEAPQTVAPATQTAPSCLEQPCQDRLYPGAQISEDTGVLMLHALAMKHGLTQDALTDILQLVRLHMPAKSPPSSYKSLHRLLQSSTLKSQKQLVHILCCDCSQRMSLSEASSSGEECMHLHRFCPLTPAFGKNTVALRSNRSTKWCFF